MYTNVGLNAKAPDQRYTETERNEKSPFSTTQYHLTPPVQRIPRIGVSAYISAADNLGLSLLVFTQLFSK